MTDRNERRPGSADETVRDIRRATRRKFSAEEKIRIVLEVLCMNVRSKAHYDAIIEHAELTLETARAAQPIDHDLEKLESRAARIRSVWKGA